MQASPTVTAAEIARLAGVGRAAVSNWRRRYSDFPTQVGGTSASPRFDLAEVEEWLRRQGRLDGRSIEDRLWWSLAAAGDDPLATLGDVGETLLRERDGARGAGDRAGAGRLADLMLDVRTVASELGEAATVELLRQRLTEDPAGRGRDTPDDLADLMAGLAGTRDGSVLDPACGLGSLLRGAVRAGCVAAYGQDVDPNAARLAGAWLGLHGVPGEVAVGDSLRADAFAGNLVDAVVCAPPFGQSAWGQEELAYDPRWTFGVPPRTEPELAWVQHALAHVRPGGRAVVLMPPAAAGRRAGRRIRAELMRRGALRAVIALPPRAAAVHGVPLHLWVLRRPVPGEVTRTHVLLINATGGNALGDPAPSLLDFPLAAVDEWLDTASVAVDGIGQAVPIVDLLDDEVDVSPARRMAGPGSADATDRWAAARSELLALLADLPDLVPDLAAGGSSEEGLPLATVAELARAGALQILGPNRPGSGAAPARPTMTVKNVLNGTPVTSTELTAARDIELCPGDVVVPVAARRLVARVIGSAESAVLGHNLVALRPADGVLDPWFLAGQLSTSTNNHRLTGSVAGMVRFDARRAQVVRLTYELQRPYGDAFRRLARLDAALRRVAAIGDDLVRLGTDALAAGGIRSDDQAATPPVRLPARRRSRT